MSQTTPKIGMTIALLALFIVTIACGSSTSEQLASALPPSELTQEESAVSSIPTQSSEISEETPQQSIVEPASPTPKPEPIEVVQQGFGQKELELGYGFIVKNPNPNLAIESSEYQVAVYNADGSVIDTDSGYINLILPGENLGVGGSLYLDEGITAARFEVTLNAGSPVVTELDQSFKVESISYIEDEFFSFATGIITNPFDRDITDLRVSSIAYNEAGDIIGGGFTFLNFIKTQNQIGVKVSVTSTNNVSKIELYPTLSGLSDIESSNERPEGTNELNLLKFGFGQSDLEAGYGFIVENPNPGFSVYNTMFHVTALAEDGSVITTDAGYINTLLPLEKLGIGGDIFSSRELKIDQVDIQILSGNFEEAEPIQTFTAENISYQPDDYFPKVTGEIISPYSQDISDVRVSALPYDENGEIIGGGFTFLDFVPANSSIPVEVHITSSGTPASIELYPTTTSLTEIE